MTRFPAALILIGLLITAVSLVLWRLSDPLPEEALCLCGDWHCDMDANALRGRR